MTFYCFFGLIGIKFVVGVLLAESKLETLLFACQSELIDVHRDYFLIFLENLLSSPHTWFI